MKTKDLLINSYRKFKSYVFYGGSLDYLKPLIAEFEANKTSMEATFEKISSSLDSRNIDYFKSLIDKRIEIAIFPKSINPINDENDIVSNESNGSILVDKINFFIKTPIEIFIIDAFWACILAGATRFGECHLDFSYGNSLSKGLFNKGNSQTIIENINFHTLVFYEKYFDQYKKWRNQAVHDLKFLYHRKIDSTMLSLDLSRFYYSVNVSFDSLYEKLSNNGSDYSQFAFVHNLMKNVYISYANTLRKYDLSISKNRLPIPIGLMSSGLVANLVLSDFDSKIYNHQNVTYYARYVDDILIVIRDKTFGTARDAISIFNEDIVADGNDYYLSYDKNLKIQNTKIKMFKISATGSKNIIDYLEKESFVVSEQRLFPDVSVEIENFKSGIYKDSDSIKVRDKTGLTIDNKKLIYLINSYLNSNKFSHPLSFNEKDDIEAMLQNAKDLINSLFNYHDLLSVYSKWNKIVLFSYVAGTNTLLGNIKKKIIEGINSINLCIDDTIYKSKTTILKILKTSLRSLLDVAVNQKRALVGEKAGIKYRRANLIDFYCVSFPTINYYTIPESLNLLKASTSDLAKIDNLELDLNKVTFSPKFIHLGSFLSTANVVHLIKNNKISDPVDIYNSYKNKIAPTFGTFDERIDFKSVSAGSESSSIDISFKKGECDTDHNEVFIGLANINLANHEIEKDGKLVDTFYCNKGHLIDLISLLNSCSLSYWEPKELSKEKKRGKKRKGKLESKNINLDFLLFPEAYLEIEYLQYLEFYARKMGTTIVVGLKYIIIGTNVFNVQAVIIPFVDSYGHKSAYTLFREKNNYAPREKEILAKTGYVFRNTEPAIYYCFENQDGIRFTAFICYELTDIYARAAMQNKVDILFASELNADIKYFSSIIDSASRELYCYVAQTNSSNFGGTRIMAPFHHNDKIIASVSGGIRSFVHVDKVDVALLRDYLKDYTLCDGKNDYSSLNIDKYKKFKKPSANVKK